MQSPLIIRPFHPADQAPARALILAGLQEYWGTLDNTLNPDLEDLGHTYRQGCFLIAWLAGELVGTGAILPLDADTAQIMRMSVSHTHRRRGIGSQLLSALVREGKNWGARRIILETTANWLAAIRFYQSNGFRIMDYQAGDCYLEKRLPGR